MLKLCRPNVFLANRVRNLGLSYGIPRFTKEVQGGKTSNAHLADLVLQRLHRIQVYEGELEPMAEPAGRPELSLGPG